MTTDQIQALNTDDMAALTTAHIGAMTTDQIAAITTTDFDALTTMHIAALSTAQVAALTTDQISHMTTTELGAFTTAQAHAMTTDQLVAFTTDQITSFSTHDLAALSMTQASAFTSDQIGVMHNDQINALVSASPIVLDLTGAGIHTTAAAQGVNFDLDGTGQVSKVGWTTATEGLLALDLNGNGNIDNGTELFGVATKLANGQRAGNGFAALAQYDTNGDGVIDAKDPIFSKLSVWVDANHDGKVEAGEMHSLTSLGIVSLDLHALAGTTMNNGNLLGLTSSYTTTTGATHAMDDVWFAKDTTGTASASTAPATSTTAATTPALSDLLAAPATDVLPGGASSSTTATTHTDTSTAAMAHTAAVHGLMGGNLLGDDEHRRNTLL